MSECWSPSVAPALLVVPAVSVVLAVTAVVLAVSVVLALTAVVLAVSVVTLSATSLIARLLGGTHQEYLELPTAG